MDTSKYFIVYVHFGTSCLFYRMTDFKFTYWHILSFLPHVIIVIMNVIFVLFYCMLCQKWRNKDVQSINHSIHQKSSDFINGNFVYLALICAVWSSRGRAGKKVTAVTFFRCPTAAMEELMSFPANIHTAMLWFTAREQWLMYSTEPWNFTHQINTKDWHHGYLYQRSNPSVRCP